jgi:hypothetical protein
MFCLDDEKVQENKMCYCMEYSCRCLVLWPVGSMDKHIYEMVDVSSTIFLIYDDIRDKVTTLLFCFLKISP